MKYYFVSYVKIDFSNLIKLDLSNYRTTTIKVFDGINKDLILNEIQHQLDELGEKEYPLEKYKIFNISKL